MASIESSKNLWKMFVFVKFPNQKNRWNFCIFRSVNFIFSYIEGNYMMCSKYMRYREEIDEYLQNRPHPLIRHCLLKKNIGENMDLTGIRVTTTGKFFIIYYKDGQRRLYNVDFGSDETMPSCSCPGWKMSAHPCKHFSAIFKKYTSWDWNSQSKLYKNSPYLTLDENVTDSTEFEAQPVNENLIINYLINKW